MLVRRSRDPGYRRLTTSVPVGLLVLGLTCLMALPLPVAALAPDTAAQPSPAPSGPSTPAPSAPAGPSSSAGLALPGWTRLDADGPRPTAREDHTLTVDDAAGVAWLFGGRTAGGRTLSDLWRLDLATDTWQRVPRGDRAPRGRFGHGAAWVPDVGLVIWAGQSGRDFLDDLWAYRPDTSSWRRLADPDQRRPRARYGSCMSLGLDGRLWISHGFTDDLGRFDDTWAFDIASERWHEETPDGRHPGARCLHDCAWAPDGRLVLYGGQSTGVPALGDLWTMTVDEGWRQVAGAEPPTPGPVARSLPALAIVADEAWLFGGAGADREPLGDLWRLDLDRMAWQAIAGDGAAPRARYGTALVADAARGRLLLYGGRDGQRAFADLWMLQTPVPSSPAPASLPR